ncbi:MAG: capsid assembly protein [Micavibrio sp.]
MTDNLLTPETESETQAALKPETLPEKFWDSETGEIRLDSLIQSYIALEKKLSTMVAKPESAEDKTKLYRMLGVPETPEEYCVNCDHGLFTPDADMNARLHERGFTPEQVQTVYDLAAEKLVPMILEISDEFKADREVERLAAAFGGPERFQEVSRQLLAFGRKNLPADVLNNLSSSFEGVMALYRMMKGEDAAISPRIESASDSSESDLRSMMRDPKYWRQKDPAFVGKVTEGFRRLYAE